jgi:hypothetical protein
VVAPNACGDTVEVLDGSVLSDAQMRELIGCGERYDGIALGSDRNLALGPAWPGIYCNHSCDPNLWMRGAVTVVARRDIDVAEELTIDYSLFTIASWWSMACRCGATSCRGTVTGDDWRRPELQRRYRGTLRPGWPS